MKIHQGDLHLHYWVVFNRSHFVMVVLVHSILFISYGVQTKYYKMCTVVTQCNTMWMRILHTGRTRYVPKYCVLADADYCRHVVFLTIDSFLTHSPIHIIVAASPNISSKYARNGIVNKLDTCVIYSICYNTCWGALWENQIKYSRQAASLLRKHSFSITRWIMILSSTSEFTSVGSSDACFKSYFLRSHACIQNYTAS